MTTDKAPAPERRASFRDVLAIREFRALYVALTLSLAGDQLARISVAVIVFARTGSTLLTASTYAVSYLPWIIGGPLLSGLADRLPRRNVMIVCDLVRVAIVAALALPGVPTAALVVLVAFVALGEPPFESARSALIPDVVGEGDSYNAAATLQNTTNQFAIVIGFAAGGGLVAFLGARPTLLIDAATFAFSAFVAAKYVERRPAANDKPTSILKDMREGAQVVFHNPSLRWLVVTTWLVLGITVSTDAAAIPYASDHGGGATTAGLLIASLPLGVVVGALILGRLVSVQTSERLMMPLALIAPVILAGTVFDPNPAIAGLLWFLAGCATAMTVTANRVFMISLPREVRGRAFGIAVTGITTAQGVFSLLVGLVARYTSTAHAIADLALPTFALLVLFSSASVTYRSDQKVSKLLPTHVDPEEKQMPTESRRLQHRAWLLTLVLFVLGGALAPALHGDHSFVDVNVPAWWIFVVLVVGQAYPLEFEVRGQTFQVVLETVPLVLGLIFLPPLELVILRVVGGLVADFVIDRMSVVKGLFNAANLGLATLAAVAAFKVSAPTHGSIHPPVWLAVFAAIIASEFVAGMLVIIVLSLTGAREQLGRTVRVIGFGAGVSVVMTFLALFTAAALDYDVATAWAISVFVFLALAAAQTYHRVVERAEALDRLYVVARELGPIASDPADLAPAMVQLRQVIRAKNLELAVLAPAQDDFATIVTVSANGTREDLLSVEMRPSAEAAAILQTGNKNRKWFAGLRPTSANMREADRLSALVRTGDRDIGVLSAHNASGEKSTFDRSDRSLLQAAADQLAAALEKGRLIESLRRAATLDTLTGLANLESLRSFLDTSLDGSTGGVVILLNLDRFREVNDMLGHDAGDAVLAEVARRLQSSPTQGALVARVGGDQFAIAIPGAAGSEVAQLAAMAVKSRVDGSIRFAEVSADVRVTIGIARAPEHGNDAATLIRRAEMAMAAAKGGTSGIGEWDPDYERDGSRRLQLLTGLRAALGDGSLRVEYQPKLRLTNGEVSGFEALVRWSHPELGPVSPAEFVPIAEATGLISALTSTVLRQALTTCRSWHDAGKPVGVAVNVSARSLDDTVLVGQVAAMLTASGLEPRWLTLEITESSVMEDHARSLEVLKELRMLGVRLSIDDFGTGYSSLHQLRGLPVHEVKIDRSFITTVDSDEADRAVVRAVVELCDSLDLVTVAEGVEKATQAYALETLGVQQVQGYFHARPMTEDVAMAWLATRAVASLATS
jgi:diguanylate cyclase (GGDEF)-like protein